MHEFSLARNVVAIATQAVKKSNAKRATSILLEIGECAGVERSSFDFVWPFAVKGTVLENANKEVVEIPGRAMCTVCNHCYPLHRLYDQCPRCGSFMSTILQGKEFKVKSLQVT